MAWDPNTDLDKLNAAFDLRDKAAASSLCDDLSERIYATAEPYPENPAKKLLSTLRRKRCFAQMEKLADAFIQTGAGSNAVRRLYAQALLDQGHFTAALLVLDKLVESTENIDSVENAEARGLLGRAYKQLYMNAKQSNIKRNQKWLDEAAKFYYGPYQHNPEAFAWHGINVVALADRAVRDQVPLIAPGIPLPTTLAQEILQRVEAKDAVDTANMWDYGTAAEASIALGKADDGLRWIRQYVKNQAADAFEFASTLRQLEEVWNLPRSHDPERRANEEAILSMLRATILEREGGTIEHTAAGVRDELQELGHADLQRVFGADRFHSLDWYRTGLARCACVARIGRPMSSRGIGTGFLIQGTTLHPSLGDELYLLTNSHVVSPKPEVSFALTPSEAVLSFEGLPGAEGKSWTIKKTVFTSPVGEFDATLLQLDRPVEGAIGYPLAPSLPRMDSQPRAYIVGHPQGGGLSFSLQDNLLLDWDEHKVHYRTPSEPGSSGSPVFDDQWRLIALHHAGKSDMRKLHGQPGTYEANEGINIQAIVARIRAVLDAG